MEGLASRIDRLPLGPPAALLLGGALAFFILAMPPRLIEQIVVTSGLPAILAAAEPPLGMTARALLAGVCAVAVAIPTWLGFVALDRPRPHRSARPAGPQVPPLRREDSHPDAPSRRPLFADTELGEPLELTEIMVVHEPADIQAVPAEPVDETFQAAAEQRLRVHAADERSNVPTETTAALMARLEAGLARRAVREQGTPVAPVEAGMPEQPDDALRSALDELRRMAGRRG